MAKAKHTFHCEKCSSPCMIYKKGKKHRVLICPNCGVLATNPFPLALLPSAIAGIGAIAKRFKKKSSPEQITGDSITSSGSSGTFRYDNLDRPNKGERYVAEALHGGR